MVRSVTLVFASTNPHKVQEIRHLLAPHGIRIRALEGGLPAPPAEDATTCEGNARIKAQHYAAALGMACLADDSGLYVDALDGAPGVHSARYAGVEGPRERRDRANRNKLLADLSSLGEVPRTARLVCALCLADAQGRVSFEARGSAEAVIASAPRGDQGFGYDSLLLLPDLGRTIAELSPAKWNLRSHRAAAVRELAGWLASEGADHVVTTH